MILKRSTSSRAAGPKRRRSACRGSVEAAAFPGLIPDRFLRWRGQAIPTPERELGHAVVLAVQQLENSRISLVDNRNEIAINEHVHRALSSKVVWQSLPLLRKKELPRPAMNPKRLFTLSEQLNQGIAEYVYPTGQRIITTR
jgi:hypothetical protein